jgi:hypothetical protein
MTTQELIDYYVALLIIQYATQPNATATIAAYITELVQNQIYAQVGDGFNFAVSPIGAQIDSAVGVQLEAVASYRGAQRIYFGLAPHSYFQFPDATDEGTFDGFMDAADSPSVITWLFATAQDTQQPVYTLTDDELYRLTQFRAQVQSSPLGLGDIDNILETFFGNNVTVIDNENMTILYIDLLSDPDTLFGVVAISQSFPKPAGVLVQAIRAEMLTNFFGLQDAETGYDSSFAGFSDAETTLTTGTFISAP